LKHRDSEKTQQNSAHNDDALNIYRQTRPASSPGFQKKIGEQEKCAEPNQSPPSISLVRNAMEHIDWSPSWAA
jgi:hypothetical protein